MKKYSRKCVFFLLLLNAFLYIWGNEFAIKTRSRMLGFLFG